jgi:hypothetical protein
MEKPPRREVEIESGAAAGSFCWGERGTGPRREVPGAAGTGSRGPWSRHDGAPGSQGKGGGDVWDTQVERACGDCGHARSHFRHAWHTRPYTAQGVQMRRNVRGQGTAVARDPMDMQNAAIFTSVLFSFSRNAGKTNSIEKWRQEPTRQKPAARDAETVSTRRIAEPARRPAHWAAGDRHDLPRHVEDGLVDAVAELQDDELLLLLDVVGEPDDGLLPRLRGAGRT